MLKMLFECNIIFKSADCFQKRLFNELFNYKNNIKVTPCQNFFYNTCNKIVPRFFFNKKNKVVFHDCQKIYCAHCRKYLDKQHKCTPILLFFDFETKTHVNNLMIKMDFKKANTMVNGDNNNIIVLKRTVLTRTLT